MQQSPLDRELQRALGKAGPAPAFTVTAQAPRGNVRMLVILVTIAAGIVALVMTSFRDAAVYAKSVDQLVAGRGSLVGRRVRVEGNLVHGSLLRRDQPCEYRFRMERNGVQLPVRYAQCIVPDTFRDVPSMDVGVTIEGKVTPDGDFEATQVLAKCPSKYEMKEKAAHGEQMPHQPIPNTM